jgi:hypothetical protein
MSLLVNLLIATVAVYILFFVPLGQWKRLERHFCLKADLGKSVNIRRFSSVYLEGVQLNGLVSVFVYRDYLVFKHISPFMNPLVFSRVSIVKTNKKKQDSIFLKSPEMRKKSMWGFDKEF